MANIRPGWTKGGRMGDWLPIAASQYFHPQGAAFCYLDSNGRVTGALTATQYLYGWAEIPRSYAAGSTAASNGYWTSSSTAGADRCYVINDLSAVFDCPVTSGVSMATARVGECTDLVGVNDGTQQTVNVGTNTQDVLLVVGFPLNDATDNVLVKLNPEEIQMDT